MHRKVYLFIIALIITGLFFITPHYNQWLLTNILEPPISYSTQFNNLEPEQRRALRYGVSYEVFKRLTDAFGHANIAHPVILLPPPGYLKQMGIVNVDMGIPPGFYYFTGYEGVFASSPNAGQAAWAILPNKEGVAIKRLNSKEDLNYLLRHYNQYQSQQ